VIFNMTERENGQARALQERSLFQSQRYVTSVYRSELAIRLQKLGYDIEAGKHGQPEIKGYTQEYLDASSPRREQIKGHLQEIGREGAGAAQVAAHRTRDKKEIQSQDEVLRRHRELAAQFGQQADRVVARAREQDHQQQHHPEKTAQQAATYARNHVFERSAVQDERAILQSILDRGMGTLNYGEARQEFARRSQPASFAPLSLGRAVQRGNTLPLKWSAWSERSLNECRLETVAAFAIQCWFRRKHAFGQKIAIRNSTPHNMRRSMRSSSRARRSLD
jgi:hypothetical protein